MADDTFTLSVEVEPDPTGEALPLRFHLGARMIEVAKIVDRWPGEGYLYVKLRGSDGATYILHQDLDRGRWQMIMFLDPAQPPREPNDRWPSGHAGRPGPG